MTDQAFTKTINGFRVPATIARLTPTQVLDRIHGIECGVWSCPNCDRVLVESDYPAPVCAGCGLQTLPRRCITKGCAEICQPMTYTSEKGSTFYYDPPTYCRACTDQTGRTQRSEWCERITPRDIYSHALAYDRGRSGRENMDSKIGWWISEDRLGHTSRQSLLYVHGRHGTGKSVGVMAHAIRGHVCGLVDGLWYVSSHDIDRIARGTYSDNSEEKTASAASFYKCSETQLLIIDGAGDRVDGYPRSVRSAYERILSDRFRRMAPTIVISTRPPFKYKDGRSVFDWLDESMPSQFAHVGFCVEVTS